MRKRPSKARRRLIVRFHTSSIEKFLQARMVFRSAGVPLRYFKESQEPYVENYEGGKELLLERAIREIVGRLDANSLFFVEDTSVRIEALSRSCDFPGLAVKEWFKETSFEQLDAQLLSAGDDRRATVSSDIALFVPNLPRPVFASGRTRGRVADTPPTFSTDVEHPWLTPDTFNGWFVPDGTSKRLGEMSIQRSLAHDFRVKALLQLLERLEEFAAVLNLPAGSYFVPGTERPKRQPMLFPASPLLVVVGRVCAGKTTFGKYAAATSGCLHIEASDIMKEIGAAAGVRAESKAASAREVIARMGPDVVAREIEDRFGGVLDAGAVITGFRTLEEVLYTRQRHPGCRVVFVDCGDRIRFERHLVRGRLDSVSTYGEFSAHDREQWMFGLLGRVADVSDVRVVNEGSMSAYERQMGAVLDGVYGRVRGIRVASRDPDSSKASRLFRCLRALLELGRPACCGEIADLTGRRGGTVKGRLVEKVSDRHVNWILKDVPELARRVERRGQPIHYELLPAGRTYVDLVHFRHEIDPSALSFGPASR